MTPKAAAKKAAKKTVSRAAEVARTSDPVALADSAERFKNFAEHDDPPAPGSRAENRR